MQLVLVAHGRCAPLKVAHISVVVGHDADALEVGLGVREGEDLEEVELRAFLAHDAGERGGGRGLAAAAVGDHDDRRLGALADHNPCVYDLAGVGVYVDNGLRAHRVPGDLDVGGVCRLARDPLGHLVAHAALDPTEELGEGEVDVSLARERGHREGYVVGPEVVPGLGGGRVDVGEGDLAGLVRDGCPERCVIVRH